MSKLLESTNNKREKHNGWETFITCHKEADIKIIVYKFLVDETEILSGPHKVGIVGIFVLLKILN